MLSEPYHGVVPSCPNCKATVDGPERVYSVTVEPEQGERGLTKREVGMFRCPRCDTSFPRILGKKKYLFVADGEYARMMKETADLKKSVQNLESDLERTRRQFEEREESLKRDLRKDKIEGLESELDQLERHVKYLRLERDRLTKDLEKS
jgi:hypothetical protein